MGALAAVYLAASILEDADSSFFLSVIVALAVIFIVEFTARLLDAPSRLEYVRRHWLDLVSAIPLVGGLRSLRILRLLRLGAALRVLTAAEHMAEARGFERQSLWFVTPTLLLTWFGASTAYWVVEHGVNPSVHTFGDALYFAVGAVGSWALGIAPLWLAVLVVVRYAGPVVLTPLVLLTGRRPELVRGEHPAEHDRPALAEDVAARGALALDNAQVYDLAVVLQRSAETANRASPVAWTIVWGFLLRSNGGVNGMLNAVGLQGPGVAAIQARMNQLPPSTLARLGTDTRNFHTFKARLQSLPPSPPPRQMQ